MMITFTFKTKLSRSVADIKSVHIGAIYSMHSECKICDQKMLLYMNMEINLNAKKCNI